MTNFLFPKPKTYRSERYLDFVREHTCLMCGAPSNCLKKPENNIAAHHESLGMNYQGGKPPDTHAVPLCHRCHQKRHGFKGWYSIFWDECEVDPQYEIIKMVTSWLSMQQKKGR